MHVHGLAVLAGLWLRVMETEIGTTQWVCVAWERLYFYFHSVYVCHARAASSIYQFMMCKRLIEHETLPPLLIRNVIPLCMAQYEKLFSTTRLLFTSCCSQHCTVMTSCCWQIDQCTDFSFVQLTLTQFCALLKTVLFCRAYETLDSTSVTV